MARSPSRRALGVGLLGLVLVFGGPGAAPADGWISDAWITARAKIALLSSKSLDAGNVAVDTVDGHVSLSGDVPSAAEKRRAAATVRKLPGVQSVRNLLRVSAARPAPGPAVPDATVKEAVERALRDDRGLAGSQIAVTSVTHGLVVLSGQARSSREHLRAIEVARRVPGVRNVESRIETAPADASLDIWNNHELRQDGPGVLDAASDLWLTTQTRLRLLADSRVPGLEVSVDCRDGVITLFGVVPTAEAKQAANEDAVATAGEGHVRNELQVVSRERRESVAARDGELQRAVTEAIYKRPEMKRAAVRVEVKNGVVRLSGSVPSEQHRLFAATAARGVRGVRAVEQDVSVTRITEDPAAKRAPHA